MASVFFIILILASVLHIPIHGKLMIPIPRSSLIDPKNVNFYLYTSANKNNSTHLNTGQSQELKNSHFNNKLPTKLIIHGFMSNYQAQPMQNLKNAYLSGNQQKNVILVDYKPYSQSYPFAVTNAKTIAEVITKFIDFLIKEEQLKEKDLHIIGHSLGAHLGGFVGQQVPFTIERITGLDPAGPLFLGVQPDLRLSPDDAKFVDCLYTSKTLGIHDPICTVNYMMNRGSEQPRCKNKNAVQVAVGQCDHMESITYFAESIQKKGIYRVQTCKSFRDALQNKCAQSNFALGDDAYDKNIPVGVYLVNTVI